MNRFLISASFALVLLAHQSFGAISENWRISLARFEPARVIVDGQGAILACGTQVNAAGNASAMAVYAYTATGQIAWSWTTPFGADAVADAALDAQGNLVLAGVRGASWRVVKLNAAHQQVWGTTYVPPGQTFADDVVYRCVVDAAGRIYVAGYSLGDVSYDARITQFSASGVVNWTRTRGVSERWDRFYDLAIDGQQNVVASGEIGNSETDDRPKFAVMSFDAAGNERWSHYFLGTWTDPDAPGPFETGTAWNVGVGPDGAVYASGLVTDDREFNDIFLAKFSAGGAVEWTRQWDGVNDGLYDRAYAMALGSVGGVARVYLTGESFSNRGWDYFNIPTLAYDGTGSLLWSDLFNSPDIGNDSEDVSDNILVDGAGRVVTIGSDWTKPGYDYVVRVFSPAGQLLAQAAVDTPSAEYNVHGERCAALTPSGKLVFLAKSGGFGPFVAGTAQLGMLDLGLGACEADFDGSGVLSAQDIFAFLNAWFAGDARADVDGGGLSVQDIFVFLSAWFAGC